MTFSTELMWQAVGAIMAAVPNTLLMATISLAAGIILGAGIAVIRIGNNRLLTIPLAVIVSFLAVCLRLCSCLLCIILCHFFWRPCSAR